MTCRQIDKFLTDWLDGTLTERQRAAFEQHLDECPDCAAYIDHYRRTISLSKDAFAQRDEPPGEVPPRLVDAIMQAIRAA